jgi:hypothetical protein
MLLVSNAPEPRLASTNEPKLPTAEHGMRGMTSSLPKTLPNEHTAEVTLLSGSTHAHRSSNGTSVDALNVADAVGVVAFAVHCGPLKSAVTLSDCVRVRSPAPLMHAHVAVYLTA